MFRLTDRHRSHGAGKHLGELSSTTRGFELGALRSAIEVAIFTGKNAAKDQSNLRLKVDAAQAKLAEGRTADAIQELEDLRATVLALSTAAKPKLDTTDADAINAAVFVAGRLSVVIACLEEAVLISINLNEPVSIADDRRRGLQRHCETPPD